MEIKSKTLRGFMDYLGISPSRCEIYLPRVVAVSLDTEDLLYEVKKICSAMSSCQNCIFREKVGESACRIVNMGARQGLGTPDLMQFGSSIRCRDLYFSAVIDAYRKDENW